MRNEATEEMLAFTTEVCRKYEQVKTIAEGAEASWKQNLEMAATSKYPGEKEMYDQQAAEDLSRYTAAKEWLKLVDGEGQREKGAPRAETELLCWCHHEVNPDRQKGRDLYEPVNRNKV